MSTGRTRTPLRRLLALTVLVAVLLAVALIGVVTHVSVSHRLTAQTDQELTRAIERAAGYDPGLFGDGGGPTGGRGAGEPDATSAPADGGGDSGPSAGAPSDGGGDSSAPGFLSGPGQGEYTLAAVLDEDGTATEGGWVDAQGAVHDLTQEDAKVLREAAPEAAAPRTVELGIGTYRVQSVDSRDGGTILVGVSVEEQQQTVRRLDLTLVAVGIGAAVLATAVGLLLISRSLRPLVEVAHVADAVSDQDLAADAAGTRIRVRPATSSGPDEVARVSRALNAMLDHVDEALAARHRNEQTMARFVADASHELRTPLTIMGGYLDLLRGPALRDEDERARALERVRAQTSRMARLVEDLLLLNRLEQAERPARIAVALDELALDAAMDAQTAATSHSVLTDFEDLPDGEARVLAAPGHVERILANLLSNAVKHTPAGTSVEVRLDRDGDGVVLEVIDDGPGMDAETLASIFDRFSRADPSRSSGAPHPLDADSSDRDPSGAGDAAQDHEGARLENQGSAGLGMALVRALAEADGADVEVRSAPGNGTRVRVRFEPAD
ncbi:cell wall metabolism sensor histidine kinase WalK [Brachybacterium sp. sponge]|uniref:sensor histidine kinase n=1 Tax=Brachybacterium sp. sponge TaxID=1775432 RepID=UPI0007A5643D|nr:HAMP domain-containing sensor histidine kinase [Brachybacterium sp. sponge]